MKNFYRLLALSLLVSSAEAVTVNGFELQGYGFIKSSAMYADKALASYNNINLSAPTHAVAQTRGIDKTSRMSFQTQQSRVGSTITKDNLSAKLEFDFIDFSKSSPTTQMLPRVRIAAVTYKWDNNKLVIGQDWDLFSPTTTYTFDYVGLYFMAGNTGFMRQQAQYLKSIGAWEYAAAFGMAGNNPGVSDNNLELGKSPTYALRITRNITDGKLGLSGIYSTLHYALENVASRDSYGANAFYERKYGALAVKSELYYGQNMANIGTLAIGKGTSTTNLREFGGTMTANYQVVEDKFIFGGVGVAKVDNKATMTPFQLNSTTQLISQPGVASNFLSRLGYDYRVTPDFSWMTEVSRYETSTKTGNNNYKTLVAHSIESGIQFRF